MLDIWVVAKYVSQRFRLTYGIPLDEMKLHKLLYFIQRECFLMFGSPLFNNQFEAWKYGPVMRCLRGRSWDTDENLVVLYPEIIGFIPVFDKVFHLYAHKDSWSLSSVSHGETCWQKAKAKEKNSIPVEILTEDIRIDAENIRLRRLLLG